MKFLIKFSFLILSLIIFGCKSEKQTATDTTLDIALRSEPPMINPFLNPSATSREVYQYLFTPMADFNPKTYKLEPILIKDIPDGEEIMEGPHKGGTKYTLEFREDAKWENGSPITAEDYLFSIKSIMHPGTNANTYRSYIKWISDVQIDKNNNRKFDVIFSEYYLLAKELAVTMEVYPKYHYDPASTMDNITLAELKDEKVSSTIKENEKLSQFAKDFNSIKYGRESASGAGPYKLKEWIADQTIILEKKQNYWGKESGIEVLNAHPEKIVFHIIPDETVTATQLKAGNIDVAKILSSDIFFNLKTNKDFEGDFDYFTPELMKYYYIAINNQKPELSDPDVRRALAKLVDIPKLIEVLENGLGTQTVGAFNAKKPYYNDSLEPITFDIEEAKQILSDEGWKDSDNDGTIDKVLGGETIEMELDFYITGSDLSRNIALLMQENAAKAGININIISKKYSEILRDNINKMDYDMVPLILGQNMVLDDPYAKWHSDNAIPSKTNQIGYTSEKADLLIDKILSTKNDADREQYYRELQEVMYNDQPVIFLYNPKEKLVVRKPWQGFGTMKRPGYLGNMFKKG